MKIQSKILMVALGPLAVLGIIIVLLSNARINTVVTDSIMTGLKSAAVAVRDTLTFVDEGDYGFDRNNKFCKGEFNISKSPELVDNIKEASDIDITIFYGNIRYMTSLLDSSDNRMIGTRAGDEVVKEVIENGNEYFSRNVDVYGEKYFGYYIPLYNNDGTPVGMVFAGIPQADAKAQIQSILLVMVGIVLATAVLAAIFLVFIVRRLVRALRKGSVALEQVAHGDLNVELDKAVLKRKDEIGNISRAIMRLKEELSGTIAVIKTQSDELNGAAAYLQNRTAETSDSLSQVERAVGEVAEGATNQAEETQTATDNVVNMGHMVEETANEADEMNQSAQNMRKLGQEAFDTLHELQRINEEAKQSIDVIYEQTNTTNQSAQKIKEATNLITSIAEETNLLSLNAAIEAARAGEQGRGFAVVASQIQKLAEQSNESAKQIEDIISDLIADSDKSVETMDIVRGIMDKQSQNVVRTDECFGEVLKGIERSIETIGGIADKAEKMNGAKVSVVDSVQNLTAIAEENAASTEETSASIIEIANAVADISARAEQLKGIADKMDESMAIFKL